MGADTGKKRIAILISGRGSNMEAILKNARDGILKECCEVVLVFSNRADAGGLATARGFGLETRCIESKGRKRLGFDRQLVELLEPYDPDYLVLAGYMRILSPPVVRRYWNRIVNIHPADTGLYKGLHGYRWAFEQKLETTSITVHLVDEGVDTGPVLGKRVVGLAGADTLEQVEQRGLEVEHEFYSEVLRDLFSGTA